MMASKKTGASKLNLLARTIAAAGLCAAPAALFAQDTPVSLRDSFPIGSNGLCQAQIAPIRDGDGLFDRRYSILCRDAAGPVGELLSLRGADAEAVKTRLLGAAYSCAAPDGGTSATTGASCTAADGRAPAAFVTRSGPGGMAGAAGLASYASALELAVQSIATDRLVDGTVDIPITSAGDAASFARAQAEATETGALLGEAYRRSNSGDYADAAEFFIAFANEATGSGAVEAALNAALQQSNLGNYAEAARRFGALEQDVAGDPVQARLLRNYRAIDALNRDDPADAIGWLDQRLAREMERADEAVIDAELADRLNAESYNTLSGASARLTLDERRQLLDGQSDYLRGTALRQTGDIDGADRFLRRADASLASVRGGRVASIIWLRAQVLGEIGDIAHGRGDAAGAEAALTDAVRIVADAYPDSPALLNARARLAGHYARTGRTDEARAMFRELADSAEGQPAPSLRRLLRPYFRLLADDLANPDAVAEMFLASQLLVRPGVAQTQAVLARELSGGSDEAAQLFRKAVNLTRANESARARVATLAAQVAALPEDSEVRAGRIAALSAAREEVAGTTALQVETQARLAAYPRFRAVSSARMTLDELRDTLSAGEAYYKLVSLGRRSYAIFATPDSATAFAISMDADTLADEVAALRSSIVFVENGANVTLPFDIERAHDLFGALMGPVADRLAAADHLVFEPDGALLTLPANLLVTDRASVDRYMARAQSPDSDPYDFSGTAWLGRTTEVSTAVSPGAFRDVRAARGSDAANPYIGFGENQPILAGDGSGSTTRSVSLGTGACEWSPAVWSDPITAAELRTAGSLVGGAGARIVTGADFSDSAIRSMEGLDDYRVLHFATHGLVTGPSPQCPPRPALLTSFGGGDSDGLLSFAEIFDLKIDADLVILSACDTAGTATKGATREAGVTTGGDFALDGLVRAFVGAGGRSIVASHWPVPDDYDATERLISGLFTAGAGTSIGAALRQSQVALMDDPRTSHPFYWSAFAIVGDAAATPLSRRAGSDLAGGAR